MICSKFGEIQRRSIGFSFFILSTREGQSGLVILKGSKFSFAYSFWKLLKSLVRLKLKFGEKLSSLLSFLYSSDSAKIFIFGFILPLVLIAIKLLLVSLEIISS